MADTSLEEIRIGVLVWQVSNRWQSNLRKILKKHNITLNEFLLLDSITKLNKNNKELSQNKISKFACVDISVTSVTLKLLESKNLIDRNNTSDNRKKNIELLSKGKNLYNKIYPDIIKEEEKIFNKLRNEMQNFTNSLKLLLGKTIRIKAEKFYE